ncbi:endonuclease domain-containing protein [Oxynema aestuarii]|jgi:very-short-patch-repair endonuclease|uniref:Endonuclease domain-containing protein n=1 Tax=Oxynema aestuarii AP17 TaxID=2064643 RepID=A0A6H1U2D2_9CYAN|nr:endonuclease domain-containing protein [Oxynema aestuarii]QIZ71779.1 endonuclease domain-containing protein [Oxynema aestuarii AP17]
MPHLKQGRYFLPYNPLLVEAAKQMRKNPTPAERKLWQDYLRQFPLKVWRQKPIDNFIVDFYCAKLRLVIEVDGESHFTKQGIIYDGQRTHILEGYGLEVVRFTNDEVMNCFDGVCECIRGKIPPKSPL